MSLQIYNTMSGAKEPFVPLSDGKVGIYVCGPTVYDMSHLGHARVYVAFDTVVRYLRRRWDVRYVRNFTDVDDKIINRAKELGEPAAAVSERFIDAFVEDMAALGCARADTEPKVTEHIDDIVRLIDELVAKEHAYAVPHATSAAAGNDVYYAVESFATYGRLGRRKLDDMEAGARVEIDPRKRNPMDFALWKGVDPDGALACWDSPWGKGRPGWHIECSAMSRRYLGETFDIHGGGKDLIFPHHENEIAQSEGASGKTLARFWMHNGFVNIDNEKMSKSLGNFFTVRDICTKFDTQTVRYYLLTTHYRSPINFSDGGLREAEARIKYLYETLGRLQSVLSDGATQGPYRQGWVAEIVARFEAAMDDDFNTARVLGDLSDVFKLINEILDKPGDAEVDARTLRAVAAALAEIGEVLGLFVEAPQAVLGRIETRKQADSGIDGARVEALLAERLAARKAKDFARADGIRDELAALGVVIKDTPQGTTWELAG